MAVPEPLDPANAHRRFARAVLGIYVAAATVTLVLLVTTVLTDRTHEQEQLQGQLLFETIEKEHHIARHLARLVQELRRLGLRSEVDLLDENMAPEKSLLRLSHAGSTFFNLGVAILATDGSVLWSEPEDFLGPKASFATEPWFRLLRKSTMLRIVPADANAENAALYVVSPVVRNGRFSGALLGAVDLAHEGEVSATPDTPDLPSETIIATPRGVVVYPRRPPDLTTDPAWFELFSEAVTAPTLSRVTLLGRSTVVGLSPIAGTDLLFVLAVDQERLSQRPRARMYRRLSAGITLTLIPLAVLVILLHRSLRGFRASEERLMRDERLRLAGEAANLIAHEVKNSINGIQMAIGIASEPSFSEERRKRAAIELRRELDRLSQFTSELMTFSKGIVLRPIRVNLSELISGVVAAAAELAIESGVTVRLASCPEGVYARADPSLLHVVMNNLLTNAIEACSVRLEGQGCIEVSLIDRGDAVLLSVADNGPGVSEAMKSKLFSPFESGKPSGVGIGLALSKRIAAAHGGDLFLEAGGAGATFTLTLPKGAVH